MREGQKYDKFRTWQLLDADFTCKDINQVIHLNGLARRMGATHLPDFALGQAPRESLMEGFLVAGPQISNFMRQEMGEGAFEMHFLS